MNYHQELMLHYISTNKGRVTDGIAEPDYPDKRAVIWDWRNRDDEETISRQWLAVELDQLGIMPLPDVEWIRCDCCKKAVRVLGPTRSWTPFCVGCADGITMCGNCAQPRDLLEQTIGRSMFAAVRERYKTDFQQHVCLIMTDANHERITRRYLTSKQWRNWFIVIDRDFRQLWIRGPLKDLDELICHVNLETDGEAQ